TDHYPRVVQTWSLFGQPPTSIRAVRVSPLDRRSLSDILGAHPRRLYVREKHALSGFPHDGGCTSMFRALIAAAAFLAVATTGVADEPVQKIDLSVLYLGNPATPRGRAYADFLGKHFRKVEAVERKSFDPKRAEPFDVVILDWSQAERPEKPMSPLG